jgi:hypothetical protein
MLADLADEACPRKPDQLAPADDPAIALLDSWAAVLDVLCFYQERIGNENYLRTATERRSVLELARAIGYELRPGVAASTWLAFTLETAPGAPLETRIDIGARAQSVPGQDETAQTFETLAAIDAKVRWNALPVLASRSRAATYGPAHHLSRRHRHPPASRRRAADHRRRTQQGPRQRKLGFPPRCPVARSAAQRPERSERYWLQRRHAGSHGLGSPLPRHRRRRRSIRAATRCAPAPTCLATTRRTGGRCRPTCAPPISA